MEKFIPFQSEIAAFPEENTDTDQIIPARFLKATDKTGFGKLLFYDRRYDSSGSPRPEFILNNIPSGRKILLAGKNFGCGSSREHAAWALLDYGFKVVISESFADIFRNNALNNGLLPIELSKEEISILFNQCNTQHDLRLEINLNKQSIRSADGSIPEMFFHTDGYKRHCLLEGVDDIEYLTGIQDQIVAYEKTSRYLQFLTPITSST
jgi:3-isopropylmalate/(R)-2-methylmalate dehydratase small subunit